MKLAMIGLGRMGGSMTERLLRGGHAVVAYAPDAAAVAEAETRGAIGAHSVEEVVRKLEPPRVVWLMIPVGPPARKRSTRSEGYVEDSGMGRWTGHEAVELAVPVPALADALFARFASRQQDSFSAKVIAALRNHFGGHAVRAAQPK